MSMWRLRKHRNVSPHYRLDGSFDFGHSGPQMYGQKGEAQLVRVQSHKYLRNEGVRGMER